MGGSYKCMPGSDPGDGCYNYRVERVELLNLSLGMCMSQSTLRRPEVHTRYIQFNVNAPRVLRLWGLMICMPRTWWQK